MGTRQSEAELRTTAPREVSDALDLTVRLGGISKATIVRVALIDQLTVAGVLYPEISKTLRPTKPRGRLRDRSTQKVDR
ncbi:hypothetical protein [Curtobacterium sp. Arg-1]|uniref:hypothetical protein n=1 Tax=Curtobacterium sp. Arg-1 TaxID=2935040 RepID=UPI0021D99EAA|nr:hypothetical protein [Curtobacterium sp. Arg-1]UXZ58786.1 hypothetical protein MXD64_05245 [Curtobacterium sp. Arg-1]